jgi:hypothetical protein
MSRRLSIHDPIVWEGREGQTAATLNDLAFEDVLAVLAKRVGDRVDVDVLGPSSDLFWPLHAEGMLQINQDPLGLGHPLLAASSPLTPEESVHDYDVLGDDERVASFTVDGAAFRGAVLYGDTHMGPPPRLYITLAAYAEDGRLHRMRLRIMFNADKRLGE